jgi:parallel beta-helix repeat protein
MENVSAATVSGCEFQKLAAGGRMFKSDNSSFVGNYVHDIYGEGFKVSQSSNCMIERNVVKDSRYGITVETAVNCTVSNNNLTDTGFNIYAPTMDGWTQNFSVNMVNDKPLGYFVNLSDTSLDGSPYGQIILVNSTRVTIHDAEFQNSTTGITMAYCVNGTIEDISCSGETIALLLRNLDGCLIRNVTIHDNGNGVHFYSIYNCSLVNSTIQDNSGGGVSVQDSVGCIVTNCTIQRNSYGVYVRDSSGPFVRTSSLLNNSNDGIYMYNTVMGVALNNTIFHNQGYGLYLGYGCIFGFFSYNRIGWNDGGNAYDGGGSNQWDDAISLGNYWSDHQVPGEYSIDGVARSRDRYPQPLDDHTGPTIRTGRTPNEPTSDTHVNITASVSDLSPITQVILSYSIAGGSWTNFTMWLEGSIWWYYVPELSNGTTVQYKVYAEDSAGNWAVSPTYPYTVYDPPPDTTPTTSTPTTPTTAAPPLDSIMVAIAIGAGAAVIIMGVVMIIKRKAR